MDAQKLLGIIVTIALLLSGFALKEIYDMNASILLLQQQVQYEDEVKRKIAALETEIDRTRSKFWKLHGWEKDQLNHLRIKHGEEMVSWPGLGE